MATPARPATADRVRAEAPTSSTTCSAHHELGHTAVAVEHAGRALDLYVELHLPEAGEIRSFLTELERLR